MKRRRLIRAVASPAREIPPRLLQVQPVSQRSEELVSITRHLLAHFAAAQGKEVPELSQDAADYLTSRRWRLRDLATRLSQAVAANQGSLITAADLA